MHFVREVDALQALMPIHTGFSPVLTPVNMTDSVWNSLKTKEYVTPISLPLEMAEACGHDSGIVINEAGKRALVMMQREAEIADLRHENDLLKDWIRCELIIRNHDRFRGAVWTRAYDGQQRLNDGMWSAVFDDAPSLETWLIAQANHESGSEQK